MFQILPNKLLVLNMMFFSIIVSEDTLKPQENTGYLEFEGLEINCMTKQQGNTVDSLNGKNSFMEM